MCERWVSDFASEGDSLARWRPLRCYESAGVRDMFEALVVSAAAHGCNLDSDGSGDGDEVEEDGAEARIVDGVQAQVWGVARVKCSGGVLLWVLVGVWWKCLEGGLMMTERATLKVIINATVGILDRKEASELGL